MSRKFIHKCDGCGVEIVDDGDLPGMPPILGAGRKRGSDSWSNFSVSAPHMFGASFDLCDSCTKRVIDLLELEIPKPEAVMRRLGGLGGHGVAGGYVPDDFMSPPWARPTGPTGPLAGALTPEDLKALGLEIPRVTPADVVGPYKCPSCQTLRTGPVPGFVCPVCQHQD